MLVKLTDNKGKDHWINPVYIKMLVPKGADATDVWVSGWGTRIRIPQPAELLADLVGAAMLDAAAITAAITSDEQTNQDAQTAAVTAATMGG